MQRKALRGRITAMRKSPLLATLDLIIDSKQFYKYIPALKFVVRVIDLLPSRLIVSVPRSYQLIFTSMLFSEKLGYFSTRKIFWLEVCEKVIEFRPYVHMIRLHLEYLTQEDEKARQNFINKSWEKANLFESKYRNFLAWSVWNLNHKDWQLIMDKHLEFNRRLIHDKGNRKFQRFIFPNFTPHMGHMAIAYLQNINQNPHILKEIIVPKLLTVNQFYWDLLKKKLHEENCKVIEAEELRNLNENIVLDEYLNFDRNNNLILNFAVESGPKRSKLVNLENQSQALSISREEQIRGRETMKKLIDLAEYKGLVALHIRGTTPENLKNSQARDCEVESYYELCEVLSSSGYYVVRMGDSTFPKLSKKFHGIVYDYAHSEMKSGFMDCWFWSNMKFWVGNMNGVQYVARSFGKPILMTNQWYWNPQGSNSDLFIPKLLSRDGQIVAFKEVVESKVSRSQSRQLIEKYGYRILENDSEILAKSAIQMVKKIELNSKEDIQELHPVEREFLKACDFENRQDSMRFPEVFIESLSHRI